MVADLDKRDAELFTNLCRFGWTIANRFRPLIYDAQADIYNNVGINFDTIGHLESLNLLHFSGVTHFEIRNVSKHLIALYYDRNVVLNFPNENDNTFPQGQVLLTQWGLELARIVSAPPIDAYFDYIREKWRHESLLES